MKRVFTIIAILIVLIGIGIAAYFLFFSPGAAHLTVNKNGATFPGSSAAQSQATSTANVVGGAGTLVAPGLVEITNQPVSAGVAVFDVMVPSTTNASTTGTSTAPALPSTPDIAVNYIDRQSGNVYQYTVNGRSLTRISDKTLPGIQQASWLPDGALAFVQFLSNTNGAEHIESYALPSDGQGGYFLQEDLAQVEAFGSTTLFTLAVGADSSVGTVANPDGTNPHTLFNTPLTSIQVYSTASGYLAVPKAANSLDGYVFAINSAGVFTPVLGPLRGLSILPSPSGRYVLYSYTDGSDYHMNVLDRTTGTVIELPLATLPEKCVWSENEASVYCGVPTNLSGTLPDDWYQGALSFNDHIWRIDIASRLAILVLDPSETANTDIDAVNLTLDPNAHVLVFRNKKDSSLWALSL